MNRVYNILPVLLLFTFILSSCEPWNLERRLDHDFVTFTTTIQDEADKESWGIMYDQAGYLVVGTIEESGSGNSDLYLVKVDENGNKLWHSTFGDSDTEQGAAMIKLSGGHGYALVGNKNYGGNNWQIYLVNSDIQGNKIWEEKYGWTSEDKAFSLIQHQDGGFLLLGHSLTWEAANLGREALIYRTTDGGNELTRHNFGNPVENGDFLDDNGYSILNTDDGNYVILSVFEDKNTDDIFNLHLLKLNGSSFDVIWDQTLIENCFPINASMVKTSDGYAVLGALTSNKLSLVSTNIGGVSQWQRSYDNSDCSKGASVIQTQDDGFLIMSSGMTLIKTDDNGLETERKDFTGEALGNRCIMQASDGAYVFTGVFENLSSGFHEMKIVKMYPDITNSSPEL